MRVLIVVAALLTLEVSALGQWTPGRPSIDLAEAMLMDAGIRSDVEGLRLARTRLASFCKDKRVAARAHRGCALASVLLAMSGSTEQKDRRVAVDDAVEHADKAMKESADGDTVAVWVMTRWPLMRRDPQQAAALAMEAVRKLTKASESEPDNPRVALVQGMMAGGAPGAKIDAGIVSTFARAIELFDNEPRSGLADWWYVNALAWMGQMQMTRDDADVDAARELFHRALKLRPDYAMVRDYFLPQTEVQSTSAIDGSDCRWTPLAQDAKGDGQRPGGPDGRDVAWTVREGEVWFRVRCHELPVADFGVNLALDVDADATNGMAWWSGVTDFRFDRLVTVWVRRIGDGHRGIVGTADASDVRAMRLAGQAAWKPRFSVDADARTVYVTVPRSAIGTGPVRVLAAVGGSSWWNDDIGAPATFNKPSR